MKFGVHITLVKISDKFESPCWRQAIYQCWLSGKVTSAKWQSFCSDLIVFSDLEGNPQTGEFRPGLFSTVHLSDYLNKKCLYIFPAFSESAKSNLQMAQRLLPSVFMSVRGRHGWALVRDAISSRVIPMVVFRWEKQTLSGKPSPVSVT